MTKGVIINTTNKIIDIDLKKFKIEEFYKKCSFRKKQDFDIRVSWKSLKGWVSVFSRNTGNAGKENKYDFPPPIDSELYFGNVLLVQHTDKVPTNDTIINFTGKEWKKII